MTKQTGATAEKKALLEAFDSVIKTQAEVREAEQRADEARRRARARARPLMYGSTALTLFIAAYLWAERPAWVFPPEAPRESVTLKEASLRIGMANAAQHVERYRQRTGRVPATLAQAGAHSDGLGYETLGTTGWRIVGNNGPARLTLTSSEPLSNFLGNSFELITRRGP